MKAVEELPEEDIALEDLIERLIVIHKSRTGLAQAGQGIPHAEVVKQFNISPQFSRPKARRSVLAFIVGVSLL